MKLVRPDDSHMMDAVVKKQGGEAVTEVARNVEQKSRTDQALIRPPLVWRAGWALNCGK